MVLSSITMNNPKQQAARVSSLTVRSVPNTPHCAGGRCCYTRAVLPLPGDIRYAPGELLFDPRGGTLLVEDYGDRVRLAAGYMSRLLADGGSRVDNPTDEPVGPDDGAFLELADDAPLVQFGSDPAVGVTVAAVDGGSACLLNGRSFWLVAYRAGTVWHRDRDTFAADVDPLVLRALTQTDAKAAYAEALAEAGVRRERELADLGGVVDVLRELAEWRRATEAVAAARPGDLVLVDGSLHPGAFLPGSLVGPIHQLALDRGVDLVGVTKASKLRWGRYAPLVLRVRRRAERELGPDTRWYLRVTPEGTVEPPRGSTVDRDEDGEAAGDDTWRSEVYVARLARAGAYAFRVDAVRGQRPPRELFAVLAGLSDDPAFLGYPYPLARAHQVVSLPGHLLADLRRDLREAFLREGLSEDDVDLVMRDFHLTLNA
jgi:hypothetical protein